jgi:hypothetical protein
MGVLSNVWVGMQQVLPTILGRRDPASAQTSKALETCEVVAFPNLPAKKVCSDAVYVR